MKPVNLFSIDNVLRSGGAILTNTLAAKALGLSGLKATEVRVIRDLCDKIKEYEDHQTIGRNYYLNYKIPQIGKEFDLLKLDANRIVNLELKSRFRHESITKQLKRNHYYLSFAGKEVHSYTFLSNESQTGVYRYEPNNESISEVGFEEIIDILRSIQVDADLRIDDLFDPTNYLISPFNSVKRFISDEYFLTNQQEKIKKQIVGNICDGTSNEVFSISGAAGTGKTLLTYDIAKCLINKGKKVVIVHCAGSNSGIWRLNQIDGWNIVLISSFSTENEDVKNADVLIIDESQRISASQFARIVKLDNCNVVFSHDVNQKLNRTNQASFVVDLIENQATGNSHKLSEKIRHNRNLSSFVKKLFNRDRIRRDPLCLDDYNCVSLYYAETNHEAGEYIRCLMAEGWEHIYLSNSLRRPEALDGVKFCSELSAHRAIGQEYDNVVVTITEDFYYDEHNRLSYNKHAYYNPAETLFQAMTRTRKRLCLVIIGNAELLSTYINIVNNGAADSE